MYFTSITPMMKSCEASETSDLPNFRTDAGFDTPSLDPMPGGSLNPNFPQKPKAQDGVRSPILRLPRERRDLSLLNTEISSLQEQRQPGRSSREKEEEIARLWNGG